LSALARAFRSTRLRGPVRLCLAAGALLGALAVAEGAPPNGGSPPLPVDVAAPNPPLDKPPSATIRIVITVLPSTKKATVSWGKKRLGVIAPHAPLIVQRPRDSGPLDLVVKSDGCVPVQTRAYTFADNKLAVKLTPLEEKSTLLGYRAELPPPDAGAPADAGAPPADPDAAAP
jgi:hypothetical protein